MDLIIWSFVYSFPLILFSNSVFLVANCVDFVVIEVIIAKKALVHSDPFGYYFVDWI